MCVCLCTLALARASPQSYPRIFPAHLESHSCSEGSRGSALAPSRGPHPPSIRVSSFICSQVGTRGGAGERGVPGLGARRGLWEKRSPNVAVCPQARSGHTRSPRWTLRTPIPQTRTQILGSILDYYARSHTNPHSHVHTHTRAHTPRVPATPRQLPFPRAWQCPQLPFRLKLFPWRRQGSRREGGPAWASRVGAPRTGGSWLPSLSPAPLTW